MEGLLMRVARCCNPVPGDDIIGFITRGRGVTVHRRDCPNLVHYGKDNGRLLDARWETAGASASYPVEIEISANDRKNLLADVMASVNESKIDMTAVSARADKNRIATIHMTMVVRDQVHLDQIMSKLRKIKDVFSVRRYVYGAGRAESGRCRRIIIMRAVVQRVHRASVEVEGKVTVGEIGSPAWLFLSA
jgi:GTP diphosphokinase / guanosine-3',5'-bis(diphosphate) 3'-diphosphatase